MALSGLKVVELAGLAPVPFCGMVLADFGATVVRVDRCSGFNPDNLCRGKKSVALNLKSRQGQGVLWRLVEWCDVLLDPFRPGKLEQLGFTEEAVLKRNPKCIFARLTGFGQTGPLAHAAGHDINYIALSGALSLAGPAANSTAPPVPPGNLLGDFAGGGLMCALGILLAVRARDQTGRGQVVDCAMMDGACYLSTFVHMMKGSVWGGKRGHNLLDGGAPFYTTYACQDGKFVAVGCLEPRFYAVFLDKLREGLRQPDLVVPSRDDHDNWPQLRRVFSQAFGSAPRAHWSAVFEGTDACVSPVLTVHDMHEHKHVQARRLLWRPAGEGGAGGVSVPSASPRLSATPAFSHCTGTIRFPGSGGQGRGPLRLELPVGRDTVEVLVKELDMSLEAVQALQKSKVVRVAHEPTPKARL